MSSQVPERPRTTAATDGGDALRDPSSVVHAVGAVALLLVALVLSVYKPRGLTSYGQRKHGALPTS